MPLFDWIRSDLHSLNLDWIISKIKTVEESEQGAVDAAADANASKSAAAASATAANNSKTAAAGSATAAAGSAAQAQALVDQLDSTIAQDVTDWLDDHITPTTPAVDDTLTVSGAAADAAVTGDKITELKTDLIDSKDLIINNSGGIYDCVLSVTKEETTYSNNYVNLGTLKAGHKYLVVLKLTGFADYLSKINSVRAYSSCSSAGYVEDIPFDSFKNNEYLFCTYTPTADIKFVRLNLASSYGTSVTGAYSNWIVFDLESLITYRKEEIDERIKPANRFNIKTITPLSKLSDATGELSSQNNRATSDYIAVNGRSTYTTNARTFFTVFYDSEKSFLSGFTTRNAGVYEVPSAAYYMRVTVENSVLNTFLLTFDNEVTTNTEFGYYSEDGIIAKNIEKEIAKTNYSNRLSNSENLLKNVSLTSSSGNIYFDNSLYGDEERSIAIQTTDALPNARCGVEMSSPLNLEGIYAFELNMFIENASNISSMVMYVDSEANGISKNSNNITGFQEGWNKIILPTYSANNTYWLSNDLQYITLRTTGTGAHKINVTSIIPRRADKAKLLVVDDHGYQNFLTEAYPRLKALGIPTTWGIQPGRLGNDQGGDAGYLLTQAQVDVLANDPYSEFSFHSWVGNATATISDAENRELMQKCITYLRQHGLLPLHPWRCAWVQNNATNYEGIMDMLEGGAMHDGNGGYSIFPFKDFYNIRRLQLHARNTQEWFDTFFDRLKKTHCVAVVYTHSIVPDDSAVAGHNMTASELEMFISGIETGVSEGWLEGTTFSWLMTQFYAGKYHD